MPNSGIDTVQHTQYNDPGPAIIFELSATRPIVVRRVEEHVVLASAVLGRSTIAARATTADWSLQGATTSVAQFRGTITACE
jgi:hypothetical protein